MTARRLPSGSGFVNRMLALSAMLSLPALLLLLPTLAAIFRLTSEQWSYLSIFALGFAALGTLAMLHVQRRLATPIATWLDERDAGEASEERTGEAFRALMALPVRVGLLSAVAWMAAAFVVSTGMALRFDGWGFFHSAVLCAAASAAAFSVGLFLSLVVKTRCADVREALVDELPDPAQRRRWLHPLALRTKLLASIVGFTLGPVIFAVLLSVNSSGASLEDFTVSWQHRVLETLPAEASEFALEQARAQLAAAPLPVSARLATLSNLESELDAELVDHIREEMAAGKTSGDSTGLPSASVFAWRTLPGGDAVLMFSPSSTLREGSSNAVMFGLLLLASAVLAFFAAHLLANDVSGATLVLREEAERLASGDLSRGRVVESEDELGELARSFESMAASLRVTVGRVATAADRVESTAVELSPVSQSVTQVTADQVSGIEQATASMEEINAQVRGIATSSQSLNSSIEESSASILELGASGEELNDTASLLSSRVDDVSTSIEQMVRSVKHVSENTETLSAASLETSASMEEMASSLREVDASAEETASLSRQVISSAEGGQAKVRQTIEGMEAIQDATDTAERVIRSLHGRTEEIGAIVDVIDDVADETNLLALNAAIIAAQAGEHGRAFSVVADEIKDLAERVLASTKEIGTLISSVQGEAGNAINAIEQGSASVASGVDLAAQAGTSLEEITRASRDSGDRISKIVASLREQAKAAGHVVELMDRVSSGVDEIRSASAEQDRGNVVVFEGSVTMREVAQQVRSTTEEQARGSGRIRESIEGVRSVVEQINGALQEQSLACSAAVEFLEEVRTRTRANEESMQAMDVVTKELLRQAEGLRNEVGRFRL
jgi:methyl-accepting chemotaxis protein